MFSIYEKIFTHNIDIETHHPQEKKKKKILEVESYAAIRLVILLIFDDANNSQWLTMSKIGKECNECIISTE